MAEKTIMQVLAVLVAAFPTNKVSAETLNVYKLTLADIPADVLEFATLNLIARSKFFPTVSEIRDAAHEIMLATHKVPSAFEAWSEVQAQIALCGDYYRYQIRANLPTYSNPLIERAVEIMGYSNLCESDNLVADRAHFFRVYESLFNRAVDEAKMLPNVKDFSEGYQLVDSKLKQLADAKRLPNTKGF